MTDRNPDVQALIEEARTYLVQFGYRNTLIGRLADALEDAAALSALSGETETEWGVRSWGGHVTPAPSEDTARRYVADTAHYGLVVSRTVTKWEVVV